MNVERAWGAAFAATWAATLAPMLVAVGYGAFDGDLDAGWILGVFGWSFFVWAIAVLHLIPAIPLYVLLDKLGWVNWGTSALAGAVIGGVPLLLISEIASKGSMILAAITGGAGLVGGLTFYAVLRRGR